MGSSLDERDLALLEEILDKTRGQHSRLVARLREAENEVENLRIEIAAIENHATQTARTIDSLMATMRPGRSMNIGHIPKLEDAGETRPTGIDREANRSNVEDLTFRDFRRNNSVPFATSERRKSAIHIDFEPFSNRFNDRTITQACTMLLREANGPLHVNELYNLLVAGGMKFKGNNPTISVAVSLSRNDRFRKVDPGTFDLVIREAKKAAS